MAKKIIARNKSRNGGSAHPCACGLGFLFMASILVSLAVFMAACGSTASSDTPAQSTDAPAEEHAAQDNEELESEAEPEPQPEPEPKAEPEATADDEATKLSPEEIAQYRAEAQQRHRVSLCWVTLDGHSYHENSACPELNGSTDLIEMTVGAAIDGGYDPCYYCAS